MQVILIVQRCTINMRALQVAYEIEHFTFSDHQVVVWVNFGVLGLRNEIKRAGGRAASQTARAPLRRRFV
jgi:hypothetical protein